MKIGLIDVDGHNYPNLALMKLSAWHKAQGDTVEWYDIFTGHCDRVYVAKVFSFSADYPYSIDADEVVFGGTGYCIKTINGKEIFTDNGVVLTQEQENMFPDYSLYPKFSNKAFGFLSRGCPRLCPFCIVGNKEGTKVQKVANVTDFWNGQKEIDILDPNLLACDECDELLRQLINTGANINISQGFDIRLMTKEKAELIEKLKLTTLHFAWDNPNDTITPKKFAQYRQWTNIDFRNLIVYVLVNYNSTIEQDLHRIYTLRDMGFTPYVMIYGKYDLPKKDIHKRMQRWCNNRFIFRSTERFEDYKE